MHGIIFWKHRATDKTRPSPSNKEKKRDNCEKDTGNKLPHISNGWELNFFPW